MGKKGGKKGGGMVVVGQNTEEDQAAKSLKARQEAEFLAKAGYGPQATAA
jgi:hypothetical protein